MDKRVLFIDDNMSFIAKAICSSLEQAGYSTQMVHMDISEINKIEDKPQLIFLYLEDESKKKDNVLIYLRDLCMEEDKLLFLIGYADDVKDIKDMIPGDRVGAVFERPVNAKELGAALDKIIAEEEETLKKKHILVVDDSGTMLRTIKSWLDGKYRVSMVNSAVNAISFLSNTIPDLILLDYEMPICSGPQMLEMIRGEIKTEHIPVMFLTSKGDRESVQKVLALKPQGYMLKTMAPEKVVETIDSFFAQQKAEALK